MNTKIWLIILTLFIFVGGLNASTYYVSPSGNDSHTNTQAQLFKAPWRTISKAVREVQAGDSIVIAEGVYIEEPIMFKNSGTASKWITLTNAPGAKPILKKMGELRGIYIYKNSFIHINGLTLCEFDNDGISIFYSDYIICTNIHAYNNGNAGVEVVDSDHILIQDCVLHHNGWNAQSGWGDGISINNHQAAGNVSITRRNVCFANWQTNGQHGDGNGFTLDAAGTQGLHLVSNNIFFNNGGDGLLAGNTGNMRIVHNVFYRNGVDPEDKTKIELKLAGSVTANTILKNNIIYSRRDGWTIYRYDGADEANIMNNYVWGDEGTSTKMFWFKTTNVGDWIESRAPESLVGEIGFVAAVHDNKFTSLYGEQWIDMNIDDYDFNLEAGSQCVDAGTFLTKTTTRGSGNKVQVEDAGYFSDGFGKIEGDYIKVGSNRLVKILIVDYNTNIITIDSNISWNNGEDVHFPFCGTTPDVGASESNLDLPLTGVITSSDPSPVKAGLITVTLTTSKKVIKNPGPIFFVENDSTFNVIKLSGDVPGDSFSGNFNIDSTVTEGMGSFVLEKYSLIDETGNMGNTIIHGKLLKVDRTEPAIPKAVYVDE